ncbi:restriction endonuclease subunit S [Lacticaseibacillus suibinensis]|nr:restriction endonuclease subunit S [Lacticaseibacillus suibinensis]
MTDTKMKSVPKVRFEGFTDDWEQRKFFGVIQKTIDFRGRTPRKMNAAWTTSGHLALSALNVKNGYIDYSSDPHYGDDALYHRWMDGNELCKDDVLFTMEAPAGNVALVPDDQEYILSQRTVAFRTNKQFMTQQFLAVLMSTPEFQASIKSLSTGGTAQGISQKSLRFLTIKYPSNLAEQDRISGLVINLNGAIALHQRKHDSLLKLKQAYLQKMFPKNGQKTPELRFGGFTDDWEQRKLTEIVNRVNKSSNSDVLPKVEFEDIVSGEGRLNKDISSKLDSRKGTLFESENILYGKLRPYLKNWLFPDFEGVALGDFWVFEATDVSVPSFDYYLIQSDDYQKVANDTSGTKMPRSDWKNVSSTDFAIPSKDEQKQIGAFFKQLDDTITLHQQQLDNLKQLKKWALQNLFV